jgi:transcriptional regulator with XRE-family HTH domain
MEKLGFGIKLVEIRKAKGLTQEEVAEKCKITVRTIQRIESGIVNPRAFTIKIIEVSR